MSKPLVSIGLPAFNRLDGLKKSIDCFLNQTYLNIELIISDNNSVYDPTDMVLSYAKGDSRIKYFRQNTNIGMKNNGDFVLSKASGKYFVLASDDDWWDRDFISDLIFTLNHTPGAVCAFCDFEEVDEIGNKILTRTRFSKVRKLFGMRLHSYPDHLPLLKEFTGNNKITRLKRFIIQKESEGKSNIHRSICERTVFVETLNTLYSLGLAERWAFDALIAFTMLTYGPLAISDRVLFKCTVGNNKYYVDSPSALEYLNGYMRVIDSCCTGSNAEELKSAVNGRCLDSTVNFYREYFLILGSFSARAVENADDVSCATLEKVLGLMKSSEHVAAGLTALDYCRTHSCTTKHSILVWLKDFIVASEEKLLCKRLAAEILRLASVRDYN